MLGGKHIATNAPLISGIFYEGRVQENFEIPHIDLSTNITVSKTVVGANSESDK